MTPTTLEFLFDRYDAFFVDAYGVLVTSAGALPGAVEFVREARKRRKKFFVITNDASRTPETCSAFYGTKGLEITAAEVVSAGQAIAQAFVRRGLTSPSCAVLGTRDTEELVRRAGGRPAPISTDARFDVVVVGDDSGFDVLPTLNALLSSIHRSVNEGGRPTLLLANPDLLYPVGPSSFGFTSGSLARLLEMGLDHLHPNLQLRFDVLGKPEPHLFEEALKRSGVEASRAVVFGDQIVTDIAGARRAGIDSVLVTTGLTPWPFEGDFALAPDYVLRSLTE